MPKVPSPCISVCKFKREGHCIGCSMTKAQKSAFKSLEKNSQRRAFVDLVVAQQTVMGRYTHWQDAYAKRCSKKKANLKVLDGDKAA